MNTPNSIRTRECQQNYENERKKTFEVDLNFSVLQSRVRRWFLLLCRFIISVPKSLSKSASIISFRLAFGDAMWQSSLSDRRVSAMQSDVWFGMAKKYLIAEDHTWTIAMAINTTVWWQHCNISDWPIKHINQMNIMMQHGWTESHQSQKSFRHRMSTISWRNANGMGYFWAWVLLNEHVVRWAKI